MPQTTDQIQNDPNVTPWDVNGDLMADTNNEDRVFIILSYTVRVIGPVYGKRNWLRGPHDFGRKKAWRRP